MARHIHAYENLRGAVLRVQARPEGLAALVYHGLFGGLKVICEEAVPASIVPPLADAQSGPSPTDPALVRLLANMVLLYEQEVNHVV